MLYKLSLTCPRSNNLAARTYKIREVLYNIYITPVQKLKYVREMVIPNFVKFTYSETSHSSYISIVFLRLPTISKPSKLEIV